MRSSYNLSRLRLLAVVGELLLRGAAPRPIAQYRFASYVHSKKMGSIAGTRAYRRFMSPWLHNQFSLRQNRNRVHIVETRVGVLFRPRAKSLFDRRFRYRRVCVDLLPRLRALKSIGCSW